MTTFPDMKVTMNDAAGEPRETVFHRTLTETNTGPGGTGKRVRSAATNFGNLITRDSSRTRKANLTAEYERQRLSGLEKH